MKNFAQIDENNIVINVSIANDNWDSTGWIEYTNKACGIGYTYDVIKNIFITPQPYPSWSLNSNTYLWEAPTPKPVEEGKRYTWDEATTSWVEVPAL